MNNFYNKYKNKHKTPPNPFPTVDLVIELVDQQETGSIILIKRSQPPLGWALPGGFINYGESLFTAAKREAKEETNLDIKLISIIGVYSEPKRDPRFHSQSIALAATSKDIPSAGSDAQSLIITKYDNIKKPLCFDHSKILYDYFQWKIGERTAIQI